MIQRLNAKYCGYRDVVIYNSIAVFKETDTGVNWRFLFKNEHIILHTNVDNFWAVCANNDWFSVYYGKLNHGPIFCIIETNDGYSNTKYSPVELASVVTRLSNIELLSSALD